ncbi:hypothetical protein Cob_v007943 [Colletotrichum orbiculare MAFF 240422]|uniref:Uncharacterized protein n=1 Tax=Colletotrichum orbiculare (strain 104-T / ATCC 96160 / CBS 514.97 / LARS 414 / MAFF 240422) TaxID=1213857 RepID=A0A484FN74_COLOR|nr:hypothetical protein Cob_v007943 [Colletotrichum orbiculare MAFF 240422]
MAEPRVLLSCCHSLLRLHIPHHDHPLPRKPHLLLVLGLRVIVPDELKGRCYPLPNHYWRCWAGKAKTENDTLPESDDQASNDKITVTTVISIGDNNHSLGLGPQREDFGVQGPRKTGGYP